MGMEMEAVDWDRWRRQWNFISLPSLLAPIATYSLGGQRVSSKEDLALKANEEET